MALENDLQELTTAVKALTAALTANIKPQPVYLPEEPKSVAEVKKPAAKPAETPSTTTETGEGTAASAVTSPSSEVTFEELAAKFTDLIEQDIAKAKALLAGYGVPKLGGLSKDLYAEVLDKVIEQLNG